MGSFKFNFLLRGQLESWSLDKFFLAIFKMLPCHKFFLVTLFLPLLLGCSAETVLIIMTRECVQNIDADIDADG